MSLVELDAFYSDLDLRALAARASTLWERLKDNAFVPDAGQTNEADVRRRRARWIELVGRGSTETWEKRIAWQGYTAAQVDAALGAVRLRDDELLPDWAILLGEIMTAASSALDAETARPYLDPKKPLAFEDVWVPVVHFARRQVAERSGSAFDRLNEEAVGHLGRGLLERLVELSARTLFHLFETTRRAAENVLLRLGGSWIDETSTVRYQAFVNQLQQRALHDVLDLYPVLGRVVATAVAQWIDTSTRFLLRLQADDEMLQTVYGSKGEGLGRVVALRVDLSDPHMGGQTVSIVTFESGTKVVYKPKDLRAAAAYQRFLAWCRTRGLRFGYAPLDVIERDGYGWMRFIEHSPCATLEEVPHYYYNAGVQLALLHLLGASDIHYENLIASGPHPTLIDLETVLTSVPETKLNDLLLTDLQERNTRSLTRIGLLPHWSMDEGLKIAYDIGGLSFAEHTAHKSLFPTLQNINTDKMHWAFGTAFLFDGAQHTPHVVGRDEVVRPEPYVESLLAGFDEAYAFVEHHHDALVASEGPLREVEQAAIRHLYRPTRIYGKLLTHSIKPEYLQDGADRSIELDVLTWTALVEPDSTHMWHAVRTEVEALEQLDIPYFAVPAHQAHLPLPDGEVLRNFFREAPIKAVFQKLDDWGEIDRVFQRALIQGAYQSKQVHHTGQDRRAGSDAFSGANRLISIAREPSTEAEGFHAEAVRLGNELVERFIVGADGYGSWMGINYLDGVERFTYSDVEFKFYGGSTGIGLFLAALYRLTGQDRYRDVVGQALEPLLDFVREGERSVVDRWADRAGIGPGDGLSGHALSLTAIGDLIGDPAYVEGGLQMARLIVPNRIRRDTNLDLLGGAAGAVPILLRLYERTGEAKVLEAALTCGEHLLSQQLQTGKKRGAWRGGGGHFPAMTGFAHGAAGFTYALMRLHTVTGRGDFREAAEAALSFEHRHFVPETQNWLTLHPAARPGEASRAQWCQGAAGIALGRLLILPELDTEAVRRDLAIGLDTTQAYAEGKLDGLCCGNSGRLDILFTAGQVLDREDLIEEALRRARLMIHRAQQAGYYRLMNPSTGKIEVAASGLFKGASGIGYTLLRLTRPEVLPSILGLDWAPQASIPVQELAEEIR